MDLERSTVAGFLGQLGFSNLNLELALWLDRHLPISAESTRFCVTLYNQYHQYHHAQWISSFDPMIP